MNKIFAYFNDYFRKVDRKQMFLVTGLTALLVYFNYSYGIEEKISSLPVLNKYLSWVAVFSIAWIIPYLFLLRKFPSFWKLLVIPPFLFALKVSLNPILPFSGDKIWNNYWNHVFYWPFLLVIIGGSLFLLGKLFNHDQPFYGSRLKGMDWRPYLVMLGIMLPLVAAASTQPDFQHMYPRMRSIEGLYNGRVIEWWQKLLFELSYGSDFISIEFFFRGFLVLAFAKLVGKDAILPMACFYCTIHLGKPLAECISSYFGGMLLGIVVYNTRSIFGGLLVHLGIAWLMELFGYLAG